MTQTVSTSTSSWVSATSTAPRVKNHRVTPKPTTPTTTMALMRVFARMVATTPAPTSTTSAQSCQRDGVPTTAGRSSTVNTPARANAPSTQAGMSRCTRGATEPDARSTRAPSRTRPWRASSTAPRPETGRAARAATRSTGRRSSTSTAPVAITTAETSRAGFTPCHRARWAWCSSPAAAWAAAETGASSTCGTRPSTTPAAAASTGIAQNDAGASWTSSPRPDSQGSGAPAGLGPHRPRAPSTSRPE